MRSILFLIMTLTLLSVSCNKSGGGSDSSTTTTNPQEDPGTETPKNSEPEPEPEPGPAPEPTPDPIPEPDDENALPQAALDFETNLTFINQTDAQETKITKALEIIKLVVATDEFRTKVLNHTYGGKKTYVDNGGFTNEQIYQKILDGAEKLQPTKDNEMDMEVEMYTAATNVVGYTYSNSKRIWVNTKFFNQYTAAGVAHNLMHEWLHKLGFGHASSYSTSRDYSVPYAIGDLVGDLGKNFL